MLIIPLLFAFLSVFAFILGLMPLSFSDRPKLQLNIEDPLAGIKNIRMENQKKGPWDIFFKISSKIAFFNRPLAKMAIGQRIYRSLQMTRSKITVEEFFLIKELLVGFLVAMVLRFNTNPDFLNFWLCLSFVIGYLLPEIWLKTKVMQIKESILRNLPDTVDLLGLCVNAGLDFMMALKYVVEKSSHTVIIEELRNMMQEINVGKPRRDALRDLARKYELPDLSTFARTLIQADRMGTSVIEALNILSEDMREARFRRGEAMALKAPLKMLIPLLLFIFPVVAILVAGPVFIDFFQNSPMKSMAH